MTAASIRISGRVQGVGFRYSTQHKAQELGVTGWVRNEFDGTVSVEAEGDESAVETFIGYLKVGPPHARVDNVEVHKKAPAGTYRRFSVK